MMSENNNQINTGDSAVARVKKRSMLARQRLAVIVISVALLLLVASVFAVNYLIGIFVFPDSDGTQYLIKKIDGEYALCHKSGDVLDVSDDGYYITSLGTEVKIDPDTGSYTVMLRVDVEGTEEISYGQSILIFKQLTYDISSTSDQTRLIKSIEVHNEYGSYTFERVKNNIFDLKGYEGVPYNTQSFAQLAVSCGYTVSSVRLESPLLLPDGSIDYAEYGLASEKRTKTETDKYGNEIAVEYDYEPSFYVITTMSGDVHKVYIGDMTVTGTGYYAKYEGRDKIYVLSSSGFKDLVLGKVEKFITPQIVSATKQNTYFDVRDFVIYDKIDHQGIIDDIEKDYGRDDGEEKVELTEEEINKLYSQYLEKNSHKVCHFDYESTVSRSGTIYAYTPYVSKLEYDQGYQLNSQTVDTVLYALYSTEFTEVIKLDPSAEDLEEYGLYSAPYMILFYYNTTDSEGNTVYLENQVSVSEKTADGIFYAYSPFFNMIVGVKESSFGFLEYDELAWYEQNYIRSDISFVEEIIIESSKVSATFRIDDSVSRYLSYTEHTASKIQEGNKTYQIARNGEKYRLTLDGETVKAVYEGDFLVTPLAYSQGVPEGEGYLFYESSQIDTNGDGTDDAVEMYIYNVYGKLGDYSLAAFKRILDMSGNPIADDEIINFEDRRSTDFFIKNNYVYLTSRTSYIGRQLDEMYTNEEKYGQSPRGEWGSGHIYTTARGQTVLVNSTTGEWSMLSSSAMGIFFAQKDSSRLYGRALKIPEIVENGKIKRYGEVYYPTTENDLYYDEESGQIQVMNKKTKQFETATNEDCTIGVWCRGEYYATEGGNLIVVNCDTGDWGTLTVLSNQSYVADVYANDRKLDYIIKTTNHVGKIVNTTAMDNFKQFYGGMLYSSFEGIADLSEEEKSELRRHDDFATGENNCQLKITIKICDTYGNRRDLVFRMYQYTERRSYITVETISPDNGFASNSENAYGSFYVLRSFSDKIIEDTLRMINGEEIDSATKY